MNWWPSLEYATAANVTVLGASLATSSKEPGAADSTKARHEDHVLVHEEQYHIMYA